MHTAEWTATQREIWQRIQQHAFERDDGSLDFLGKLMREQGWSRTKARAAIEEYRKFCFLAVCAGHAVTPSEEVDQVWHLHLTYTVDYWNRFCPQVLGMALHHEGADGKLATRTQHRNGYAETLASYQRRFGVPPEEFWPASAVRFAPASNYRWVDRRTHWVIPRLRLPQWRREFSALLALIVAPPALALGMDPFEWSGPEFLVMYIVLLILAFVGARMWRGRLADNGSEGSALGLDSQQIAYLSGGEKRAIDAGVAEMMADDALRWENSKFIRGSRSPSTTALRNLLQVLMERQDGTKKPKPDWPFEALRQALESRGLVLSRVAEWRARLLPAFVMGVATAFGLMKVAVGIERGKPVGFLMVLCVFAVLGTIAFAKARVDRSRAGDKVLERLQSEHASTTRAPADNDLGLAVALIGTTALAGTAYAAYHEARATTGGDSSSGCTSSGSSCSSSDSGGGSSCSSGCGGCGGGGGD
jgi:uncharacterized protein (TIGR04222 family)